MENGRRDIQKSEVFQASWMIKIKHRKQVTHACKCQGQWEANSLAGIHVNVCCIIEMLEIKCLTHEHAVALYLKSVHTGLTAGTYL
jgi:hypothetical protein